MTAKQTTDFFSSNELYSSEFCDLAYACFEIWGHWR